MKEKCRQLNTNIWTITPMVDFAVSYGQAHTFVFSQDVFHRERQ